MSAIVIIPLRLHEVVVIISRWQRSWQSDLCAVKSHPPIQTRNVHVYNVPLPPITHHYALTFRVPAMEYTRRKLNTSAKRPLAQLLSEVVIPYIEAPRTISLHFLEEISVIIQEGSVVDLCGADREWDGCCLCYLVIVLLPSPIPLSATQYVVLWRRYNA